MQNKNMMIVIGAIAALVLLIGGVGAAAFILLDDSDDAETAEESMEKDDDKMMKDEDHDSMEKSDDDKMMKDEDHDAMEKDEDSDTMMEKDDSEASAAGSYIAYSSEALTEDKNVIFFKADWCTTCGRLNRDIEANLDNIPSNVTILDADYDDETDLRSKYGVTFQHTLVQVDQDGNELKQWSGSFDLEELLSEII